MNMMKIHPVFHALKLSLFAGDLFLWEMQPTLQPIEIDDEMRWEVEEISNLKRI